MRLSHSSLILLMLVAFSCNKAVEMNHSESQFPRLSGSYMGQSLPDSIPQLFAPGVVSTGMFTRDMAIAPGGDEIYYCVAMGNYTYSTILYSKLENGMWMITGQNPSIWVKESTWTTPGAGRPMFRPMANTSSLWPPEPMKLKKLTGITKN